MRNPYTRIVRGLTYPRDDPDSPKYFNMGVHKNVPDNQLEAILVQECEEHQLVIPESFEVLDNLGKGWWNIKKRRVYLKQ